jgi:LysR family transcriptional activator of mexEF-oprN operon
MLYINVMDDLRFDLNLLRVLLAVVDSGGVTDAAAKLYLSQPAVSAALRRLRESVGAPLLARQGRRVALTARGQRLVAQTRPHIEALLRAAVSPPSFEPERSERVFRIGLSDGGDAWLLPALLRRLEQHAPAVRLVVRTVQFRTVAQALVSGDVDLAVSVADELPSGVLRRPLFGGGFVLVYDPRRVRVRRWTRAAYLEQVHVIVSYNADLRGLVEDQLGVQRRVRCSVSTFGHVGAVVDGSPLVATVPSSVARSIVRVRPTLRMAPVPFRLEGSTTELLWHATHDDDPGHAFLRAQVIAAARTHAPPARSTRPRGALAHTQRHALAATKYVRPARRSTRARED